MPSSAEDITDAARLVVDCLNKPEMYSNSRILLIGSYAISRYFSSVIPQAGRGWLEDKLVGNFSELFKDSRREGEGIRVRTTMVRLRFYPFELLPWISSDDLQAIHDASGTGIIKVISAIDMLVSRIFGLDTRMSRERRDQDAVEASKLVLYLHRRNGGQGQIRLSGLQRDLIRPCLHLLVESSVESEQWWRDRLGL
ncbi:hypothetical protein BDV19DRAFT_384657 [Aspergillus venezuelensis]